jgi:crotonobetainyl-CoA:carnitine CoA-transferase CaiB-like acyl-CoA transferase
MKKPFENLVVLDLSRYLLGAYPSLYFADFGARVIKVEDTKSGDFCRQEQPQINGESYYHYALNRNKESISLNLKDPTVLSAFYKLVENADIIIENYRPGVTKRLKIDYETLKEINPGIIYCSLSAYGEDNPLSKKPIHDINIVAETGFYDLNEGHVATIPPSDFAAAMVALQGIQGALYIRCCTKKGCHVDVAMFDSLVWWNAMLDSRWYFFGEDFPSSKREYPSIGYNIYKTKDGRNLAFGFYEHSFWNAFCDDIQRTDLYDTLKDTPTENPESYQKVVDIIAEKTYDEWLEWLGTRDHCIAPCLTKTEAIAHTMQTSPHMIQYCNYPKLGKVLQTNTPHKMGPHSAKLEEAQEPCQLGADTLSVLTELGLDQGTIDRLVSSEQIICS